MHNIAFIRWNKIKKPIAIFIFNWPIYNYTVCEKKSLKKS